MSNFLRYVDRLYSYQKCWQRLELGVSQQSQSFFMLKGENMIYFLFKGFKNDTFVDMYYWNLSCDVKFSQN